MANPKHIDVVKIHKGGFNQQRCKICWILTSSQTHFPNACILASYLLKFWKANKAMTLFWLPTGKHLPQNKTRSCITGSRDNSWSNQNYHLNNKQKKKTVHAWCQFSVINSTVWLWVHLFIESAKYIQAQGQTSIWSYSYYSQPHSSLDKSIVDLQLASPL